MKSILDTRGNNITDDTINYNNLETLNQFTTLTVLFINNYGTSTETKTVLIKDTHFEDEEVDNKKTGNIKLLVTGSSYPKTWTNDSSLPSLTGDETQAITLLRTTDIGNAAVKYNDSALLTDTDLNTTVKQLLFKLQEVTEQDQGGFDTTSLNLSGKLNQNTNAITVINADDWVNNARIANDAVTSASILDGTIQSTDLNIPSVASAILEKVYPVGSIYMNYNDDTDPAVALNFGTWSRVSGKFLVGAMENDSTTPDSFDKSKVYDTTGGGTRRHTLSADESGLPVHLHDNWGSHDETVNRQTFLGRTRVNHQGDDHTPRNSTYLSQDGVASSTYDGQTIAKSAEESHQNLPPYKVVSMWYRVS